jgi:hypothetical protein
MTELPDFNELKGILLDISSAEDITLEMLRNDWSVDYSIDLQKDFLIELQNFQYGMDLYRAALAQEDKLAARMGLMDTSIAAQRLSDFFECFNDDITRVLTDKAFERPEFPGDYKIPAHYEYKGPK